MHTIKKQWESYNTEVVPRQAGITQRKETRRAFYAGATAMAGIQEVISRPEVTEAAAIKIIESAYQELRDFADLLEKGQA